ncbi:MAG: tRNA uridine-5-carboxymethylaminomethyl(34) synthesis GTPase MnmE [bacterium]|nr:tRNA uridine-5-carboxymethylaminomethyl(34) synthesis GTPase MnmE [bacterium]
MSGEVAQTIVALSSAPGRGGVSLVRISGLQTAETLRALAKNAERMIASPRELVFSQIFEVTNSGDKQPLDYGMGVFFPGPGSFTGEDVAEVHLHGSPYLVRRFLESAVTLGVRLARPGEFTERAFLNGRIDLVQAEAVADLVHAETESQAFVARRQLEGQLSGVLLEIGEPLRDLLSEIEAYIDFPDEELDGLLVEGWRRRTIETRERIAKLLLTFESGRVLREGASVVIVGLPNAGKSSLLNALVGEERAIVTSIAGTTRDSIEEVLSFAGIPVRLWDTAGLVDDSSMRTPDEVELIGIQQSWKRARQADLVVFLYDPLSEVPDEQLLLLEQVRSFARRVLVVGNKADMQPVAVGASPTMQQQMQISAKTGASIEALKAAIAEMIVGEGGFRQGDLQISNLRHREALTQAEERIGDFLLSLDNGLPPEISALELRAALGSLEEIIGVTETEDLLGRIFSRFCIGK